MGIEHLDQILEEVSKEPLLSNLEEPEREQSKRTFFLGERTVEPQNQVIFENRMFFVEKVSEFLLIRPKVTRMYLKKIRGTNRIAKFERGAKEIMVPQGVAKNPIPWFKKRYVENSKRNQQGRFIREIWKYKNEVFSEVTMG